MDCILDVEAKFMGGGGGELLFYSSMSPFVQLFSLRPSSSSRTKSVCDTISTPGIIAAATNAAERGKKEGGGVME